METRNAIMKDLLISENRSRAITKHLLRGLLAVVLLGAIFSLVNVHELTDALFNARLSFIAGAALLMVVNIGLQIFKWRYFVRLVDPTATSLETAASLLFGIALGTLTPGQIGEFGGRALHHNSVSAGTIIGLTVVDKVQMLCIMGMAGIVSLVIIFHFGIIAGSIISFATILLFLFVFFGLKGIQQAISKLRFGFLQRAVIQDFLSALSILQPRDLVVSFGLSMGFYAVIYSQMYLLLNAFSLVTLGDAFLGFAAMMFLKSLVPISLGDLGIREAGSMYFYGLLGISNTTALNASLILFVLNILLPSLLGSIFIPKPKPDA
jgi:uncharacterized protein (TIRG00374 family)